MRLDGDYDLPEGPVRVTDDVKEQLDKAYKGLKRVNVYLDEDGTTENIGGFYVGAEKGVEPDDTADQILDTAYRIAFMKSKELQREVQVVFKFSSHVRKNPFTITHHVIDPATLTGNEEHNAAVMAQAAGNDPLAAMAMGYLQATNLAHKLMEKANGSLERQNAKLMDDLRAANNRESSLAHALVRRETQSIEAENDREARVHQMAAEAMEGAVENIRVYADLTKKGAELEAEETRRKLKQDGTTALMTQFAQALPLLMMAGMAKMTGGDMSSMAPMMGAMMGAAGGPGAPGTPPVQTGAPPPPAPRKSPKVTQMPQARPATPSAPAPTVPAEGTPQPGSVTPERLANAFEGIGVLAAQLGATVTDEQWGQLGSLLGPSEMALVQRWWSTTPLPDKDAGLAMNACMGNEKIARAICQDVLTDEQGVLLDSVLGRFYANAGIPRPADSRVVVETTVVEQPEPEPPSADVESTEEPEEEAAPAPKPKRKKATRKKATRKKAS